MSKLNSELLTQCVENILKYSAGETVTIGKKEVKGKKRNFQESIDLQVNIQLDNSINRLMIFFVADHPEELRSPA